MRLFYIFVIIFAVVHLGCKSKTSDEPAQPMFDAGMIKGNLYYINEDGSKVTVPFEYNFFNSDSINKYFSNGENGYYKINLLRQLFGNNESHIKFRRMYGDMDANGNPLQPKETGFDFSMNRMFNNKQYRFKGFFYSLEGSRSHCTITNFSFNVKTNKLSFNFEAYFHPDDLDFGTRFDTTTPATIKGNVNVTLFNKPYYD